MWKALREVYEWRSVMRERREALAIRQAREMEAEKERAEEEERARETEYRKKEDAFEARVQRNISRRERDNVIWRAEEEDGDGHREQLAPVRRVKERPPPLPRGVNSYRPLVKFREDE